jgi:hypothetical protein
MINWNPSKVSWWGLICSTGKYVSIGRVSFWIVMCIMVFMWLAQWPVPESLVWSWTTIVGYNLVKKPLGTVDEYVKNKNKQGELF